MGKVENDAIIKDIVTLAIETIVQTIQFILGRTFVSLIFALLSGKLSNYLKISSFSLT
jgi:hypothetical protein